MQTAVLISGSGTILKAMIEAGVPVNTVVSDRPCAGLEIARSFGIDVELVARSDFGGFDKTFDRWAYTEKITSVLQSHHTDLIAMAGFGTVLEKPIHDAFPSRILNTHPALLPLFPGWHGVEDALAAGATETGCTVHIATLEMDAGPILAQAVVSILDNDSVATLHERIKVTERELYPATILRVLDELETTGTIAIPAQRLEPAKTDMSNRPHRKLGTLSEPLRDQEKQY